MSELKPAKDFIADYNKTFGNLAKFELDRDAGLANIRKNYQNEIERLQNVIYEIENEIDEVEDERERECGDYFDAINDRCIQPTRDKLFQMNRMFNIVAGNALKPVYELTEEDFEIRDGYNREIFFYDKFYDDGNLSLRAIILGHSPMVLTNGVKICNFINSFTLCIVGLTENEKHYFNYNHSPELICKKRELYDDFFACLVRSQDLEEVKKYYAMHVKGNVPIPFESDLWEQNDIDVMKEFESFLQNAINRENELHEFNEDVKKTYRIKDFKDIIAYSCPNCNKYYSTFSVMNSPAFASFLCPVCDERMMKFVDFE